MHIIKRNLQKLAATGVVLGVVGASQAFAQTKLDFYYPVQVGGPGTKVIDGYVAKFMAENPDIQVAPIYSSFRSSTK